MRPIAFSTVAPAALAFVLVGCGDRGEALVPVERAPAGLDEPSRAAMERGAEAFAEDVRFGRADTVAERVDLDAVVRGVCLGTGASDSVRQDFAKGFETGLGERPGGLLSDYLGGEFRFLRLVEVDGSTQMLFRAWDEERGIDYIRCVVDRPSEADWKVVDLYSYTAGEAFTESLRRFYLPVLAGGEQGAQLRERYKPLEEVVEKIESGEFEAAREAYGNLPEEQRGSRFARALELQFLGAIDDAADAYAAAIEAFEQEYPDDPSIPLRMLEVHSIRGQHAEALERIDQVDEMLGGDPFLHFLRARALSATGEGQRAIEGLKAAILAEPEIEALRWATVHAALKEGDHRTVAATLRALVEGFDYRLEPEELKASPDYEAFLASPEGAELLAELPPEPAEGQGDCN